jgi:8-oxo-dGTP pyrophosphatase MutT (NUDIX family)
MTEPGSFGERVLDEHEFESRYPAFAHYQWARLAVVGALARGNQVLLLRRRSDLDLYPDLWCLPGGGVEKGETIETALVREFREETGLSVLVGRSIDTWFKIADLNTGERFPSLVACFECTTASSAEPVLDTSEHTAHAWAAREDLERFPLIAGHARAAEAYLATLTLRAP